MGIEEELGLELGDLDELASMIEEALLDNLRLLESHPHILERHKRLNLFVQRLERAKVGITADLYHNGIDGAIVPRPPALLRYKGGDTIIVLSKHEELNKAEEA